MNGNINLCEILKDCPKGTTFYSYNYGNVEFWGISQESACPIMIRVRTKWGYLSIVSLTKEGFTSNDYSDLICTLAPSKDQRDWSKFKRFWDNPKFATKMLQPFEKILVRNSHVDDWHCSFLSHLRDDEDYPFYTTDYCTIKYCIPYNDDTKHLVGTSDEAPEYYRYWED